MFDREVNKMCVIESNVCTMTYLQLLLSPIKRVIYSLLEFPALKAVLATILTITGAIISDNTLGVGVLVGLVLVDQFSGVWISLRDKTFNSFAFRNGLVKLLFYLIIVASFFSLEHLSPVFQWLELDSAAIAWLAVTEVISIVENSCNILHIPFPNWILDKMRVFVEFGKTKRKGR